MFDLLWQLPEDLIGGCASLFLAEGRHSHPGGAGFVEQSLSIEVQQVLEPYYARMIDLQKVIKLPICPFGIDKVLKSINDLLDSNHPPTFLVPGLIYNSVGALANLLKYLVFFIDLVF